MAKMPFGSELILNPMTAAPGFIVKNIYVLPGVPEIIQVMFEELMKKLKKVTQNLLQQLILIYTKVKLQKFKNIQNNYTNASIGSYPYLILQLKQVVLT